MRILCFGDSITQGFYDTQGGWTVRLWEHFTKKYYEESLKDPPTIFNLGISGDTTEQLLKRFRSEVEARKYPGYQEFVFVISTGTNDTVYRGKENESEPEIYVQQLGELTSQAREYTNKVLFVGLFPVVDALLQPMPWSSTGKCYSTERITLFENALKEFCSRNSMPVVDLHKPFSELADLNSVFADGIHPNDVGHELIASLVKPELEKLLN